MNILALVQAGTVRREDNTLPMMQGVPLDTAKTIVEWLAMATKSTAEAHYMSFDGMLVITAEPGQKAQVRDRELGD